MTKYVENETYIPKDDLDRIKARLHAHIESASEAELKIAAKSDASFRVYVADLFKSIAALFGYIVGKFIGGLREIGRGISSGFEEGFRAGLGD
ncbi:MAG: hypothetical protein SAJ72_10340 [Jaaginema sp. PMC 1080.18]|nr:hypothetical protein [Jaaginema sp. PMC 1080.18]